MAKKNNDNVEETVEPIVISEDEQSDVAVGSENDLLANANKQIEEFKDITLRLQAEFDNYRKRNNESVRIARNDGINEIIIALFPIIDNFERAISAINDEGTRSGVELIFKQITALLAKYEVEEILALGEEFDPKYHHAIAQCEDAENSNKVVEVFQKGYKRKDKVLRPAMVKVAQ